MFLNTARGWWLLAAALIFGGLTAIGLGQPILIGLLLLVLGFVVFSAAPRRGPEHARYRAEAAEAARTAAAAAPAAPRPSLPAAPASTLKSSDIEAGDPSQV